MRGLFFKIFAIFWLAQSLIFIISTALIVRQHFPGRDAANEALDNNLKHAASAALASYEAGGCAGFAGNEARHEPEGAALLTDDGHLVCRTTNAGSLDGLAPHFPDRVDGRPLGGHYVWLVPLVSQGGAHYEYVWFQPPFVARQPSKLRDFSRFAFPQLPVAIAVGGVTTFALVLLFTRPLVRLRKTARQLAQGNLSARVEVSAAESKQTSSDEFQGLVHDFNHMAERLESLVGAQRLLLRDVSHELRSPLSRLSVALELVREDAAPELGTHLLRIEREAERLNQLIGQLLTLSSMETREDTATFQLVSLNQLCEQIVPDAEYEAQQRPCTVRLEQGGECAIRGDWELLHRAIENVVRNAIRYTVPGSAVVLRVAVTTVAGDRFAIVEVNDAGPGIPEAELEHIFRPFYRVDNARSAWTGGFGVGLAIAERAVRLHGGTLQASNRPSGGACVRMVFPLAAVSVVRS